MEKALELFETDDYETPIEEYPGFLGYTWDGQFFPGPELKTMEEFDWQGYWELFDDDETPREINILGLSQPAICTISAYSDLAYLFDQMKSIKVMRDEGPVDCGPASGSGYVFFIADDFNVEQLRREITALREALEADKASLSTTARQSD